jgi:sodium-dependent dicarboxylate transporter 2/3/5
LVSPEAVVDSAGTVVSGLTADGRAVAAVGVAMAVLWLTEALPVAATALLPIAALPVLTGGGLGIRQVTAPYAHDLIFLFMGGFFIALGMEAWGLHRRIALRTILLVGSRPSRVVGGFMLASAGLSMWISNTATAVMMLPIALSVIELVRRQVGVPGGAGAEGGEKERPPFNFAICLLLGTAYAASIGGVATLIGTPPNLFLSSFLSESYGREISMARWLPLGLTLSLLFLPLAWLVLTRVVFPIRIREIPGGRRLIREQLAELGAMSGAERSVLVVFVFTAAAWILRGQLVELELVGGNPLAGLSDAGIAIGAALVLFGWPVDLRRGRFLLDWPQALRVPWGILLLFGGGLSLAAAVRSTGVDEFIGRGIGRFEAFPEPLLVVLVTLVTILLTELTSNTATTATFLPIMAAAAEGLGIDPMWFLVPVTLAASCAFMMPVATPPNAIVFGSGELTIPQMCRAGLWLNLIGLVLILLVVGLLGGPLLGIGTG